MGRQRRRRVELAPIPQRAQVNTSILTPVDDEPLLRTLTPQDAGISQTVGDEAFLEQLLAVRSPRA